jgi:hypothetical protein
MAIEIDNFQAKRKKEQREAFLDIPRVESLFGVVASRRDPRATRARYAENARLKMSPDTRVARLINQTSARFFLWLGLSSRQPENRPAAHRQKPMIIACSRQ